MTWAAVLLAILAGYELVFHLIPDVKSLGTNVDVMLNDFENLSKATVYSLHYIVYSFGIIVESYIICHGIKRLIISIKSQVSISR